MAARDRFGGFGEPATTPLQRYIQNACDPQNFEANLALDLEISDLINSKKGNAPREAAVAIVTYINHRNPNVSLLALTLLDICVKNCGYPFHLQISTKDFLNELVRRFPERPPIRYTRVQSKVLELIEEWRQTICQTSKYKEDLGFIRDMHRLLSYKGYVFPEVKREDAAVLNPSDNLRSAEEMEEEERAAQSAKLQELIRRGGPHDLQEANKLMKVMAGYDTRHKTDYRAKAAEEVGKVQQKARILEEMLQGYQAGDSAKDGDVLEELANALASAQPKIQKMCEEESDDTEAVAKLFEINDSIHRTVERYRLVKKGDFEGAAKIPKGTLGTSGAGVSKGPDNELSLIDLGGPEDSQFQNSQRMSTGLTSAARGYSLEDDLLGLSMQDSGIGAIALAPDTQANPSPLSQPATNASGVSTPFKAPQSAKSQGSSQYAKPNYDMFSSLGTPSSATQTQAVSPSLNLTPNPFPPQLGSQPNDPFAALSSSDFRQGSPFQYQQATQPPKNVSSPNAMLSNLASSHNAQPQTANADDEWTFSSALPDNEITVTNSSINIGLHVSRQSETDKAILIKSAISNNTAQLVTEFEFKLGVIKGYTLQLETQSGRSLLPQQRTGITQVFRLFGVENGKGHSVKVRWKTSYRIGGEQRAEQGELSSLGIN